VKNLLFILAALLPSFVYCQSSLDIDIPHIDNPIILDGALDEEVWKNAKVFAQGFQQYFPTDSVKAEDQTTIRMAFDDNNLYIAIECFTRGNDYTIPTLKRDYRAGRNQPSWIPNQLGQQMEVRNQTIRQ